MLNRLFRTPANSTEYFSFLFPMQLRIPHSINYEETGTSEGLWDRLGRHVISRCFQGP